MNYVGWDEFLIRELNRGYFVLVELEKIGKIYWLVM